MKDEHPTAMSDHWRPGQLTERRMRAYRALMDTDEIRLGAVVIHTKDWSADVGYWSRYGENETYEKLKGRR